MSPAEHCPHCLRPDAQLTGRWRNGAETVTHWACGGCGHQWQTRYMTAAYDEDNEPP